jgi:hypothetical protein
MFDNRAIGERYGDDVATTLYARGSGGVGIPVVVRGTRHGSSLEWLGIR